MLLFSNKKRDWISRRLNGIPAAEQDAESLRARLLLVSSLCIGFLFSLWLQIGFPVDLDNPAGWVAKAGALAATITCILVALFRKVYWPGVWFGTWLVAAFSSLLIWHGEAAIICLTPLIFAPVLFGLVVDSRASAVSAAIVCLVFLAALLNELYANHYVSLDFTEHLMLSAISTALCGGMVAYFSANRERETRTLVDLHNQLESAAFEDSLTGIRNRRAYGKKVKELELAATDNKRPGLVLIDVDKFKMINDTFGHDAGDTVLIEIAQRVEDILEPGQTIFRLGGDEFAVVLDGSFGAKELKACTQQIAKQMRTEIKLATGSVKVDLSLGVAVSDGSRAGVKNLYNEADQATFVAKEKVGTSAVVYDASLNGAIVRRSTIEERLQKALQDQTINLSFQPQFNLNSQDIIGFEALARWKDQKLGVVPPNEFVQIAEQSSLILHLDRFIIAKAVHHAASWLQGGQRLSINVSARSIVESRFCRYVVDTIKRSGFRPDQIELEITETALIEHWERCRVNIEGLREAGLRIVLDDFGIGYSSLSYLSQFPVQKLKFDRSFLLQATSPTNAKIMDSIVRLAKALDVEVIAEGVETRLHVELLKALNCNTAQGFLYAKPIPADRVEDFLAERADEPVLQLAGEWQALRQENYG